MSIFDRFLKEILPLQVYGKLPIARDYLRVGVSQGGPRRLRQWMDESFSPEMGASSVLELEGEMRYLLGCYGGDVLVGVIWPSVDQGGTRRFPFTMLVERKRRPLLADWNEGAQRTRSDWLALEAMRDLTTKATTGQGLLDKIHGRALEPESTSKTNIAGVPFEGWIHEIWGEAGETALTDSLQRILELGAGGHRGPILAPLAGRLEILPQVHAWSAALSRAGYFSEDSVPSVFFPKESNELLRHQQAVFLNEPPDRSIALFLSGLVPCEERLPGDLCSSVDRRPREPLPSPEENPPLANSVLGALTSARIR